MLGQDRVADAALPHLEVPLDSHLLRELTGEPAEGCARRILRRLKVVLRYRNALGVPDLLGPHLLAHDLSGRGDGEVVAHGKVDPGQHEVAWLDAFAAG